MEPVTKRDLAELKTDIAEMLTEQTKTLMKYVDAAKREVKHDISDLRSSMYAEFQRRLDQHVGTHHR